MNKIIHKKIKKYYQDYSFFPTTEQKFITLAKKYDVDMIGYSFEDFIKDYEKEYLKYKELKTVYNILKLGYSPSSYISSNFHNFLIKGFNYNEKLVKPEELPKALEVIEIDCNVEKYNLKISKYLKHVELYGTEAELEKFKMDYGLNCEIIYEKIKGCWHLAFDGILAEYLKNK